MMFLLHLSKSVCESDRVYCFDMGTVSSTDFKINFAINAVIDKVPIPRHTVYMFTVGHCLQVESGGSSAKQT